MKKSEKFLEGKYPHDTYFNVLQTFLQRKQDDGLSPYTVERLYYSLYPIGKQLSNPPLCKITRKWLMGYTNNLWRRYAPESVRTYVGDIKQFFKWLKKRKYLTKNLAKPIKYPRRRTHRRRQNYLAPESDIFRVMAYLVKQLKPVVFRDESGLLKTNEGCWKSQQVRILRDLFILTFIYETGARVGELAALGSRPMNHITRFHEGAYEITLVGKTDDVDVGFTERTAELWRIWEKIRPDKCREMAVIGWSNSHPPASFKPNGISQMILRHCQAVKVRPFRANALRHTKVTRSNDIIGIYKTQKLMDHADIRSTENYVHLTGEEKKKAIKLTGLQRDFWRDF